MLILRVREQLMKKECVLSGKILGLKVQGPMGQGLMALESWYSTRLGWRDHQCQRVIDRPDLGSQLLET